MADIKTKDVIKGTIKTIDKGAVAATRMKRAVVSVKEKAEKIVQTDQHNPEEYATDKVSCYGRSVTEEGARIAGKAGIKTLKGTKESVSKAKDEFQRFKEYRSTQNMKETLKPKGTTHITESVGKTIKTMPKQEKFVRESVTSAGKKTIKTAEKIEKEAVKKSVKTAEKTSKATIKTSKEAAKVTRKAVVEAEKVAKQAAKLAKETAKVAAEATKKAAVATAKAVKAILLALKELIAAIIAGGWVSIVVIVIIVIFGVAIALFAGSDSNQYTPVSAEVEAYTGTIQKYANQYGVSEYVELIKAIMMQESGGLGTDPMQASESGYNTRYPNTPNGITDPAYSIEVGVQTVSGVLSEAEVESPVDMVHIKLALQGYNYGNGYISWAKSKYGGYTVANAIEFSDMKAEELGWASYGDKQYVPHVLRYYPFGRAFLPGGNHMIAEIARGELGNAGGEKYWRWYGFHSRVDWCAIFVSWCANECGLIDNGSVPQFAYCPYGEQWFKEQGKWVDGSYEPVPGTIIFFDWENDGITDHVGIVESCENGTVYTIEGNSGDAVEANSYAVGSSSIYGYGLLTQ